MNSGSKYYYNKEKQNGCDSQCDHSIPGEVLLKCRKGCFGPVTSTLIAPSFSQTFNQQIARVTIDTSCLKCPNILISFDGILNLGGNTNFGVLGFTFIFTLFRICEGSTKRKEVANFTYNAVDFSPFIGTNFQISSTLSFKYSTCEDQCNDQCDDQCNDQCDDKCNDHCNDCCTYILELDRITGSSTDINAISTPLFSINGEICALAVG